MSHPADPPRAGDPAVSATRDAAPHAPAADPRPVGDPRAAAAGDEPAARAFARRIDCSGDAAPTWPRGGRHG